MRPRRFSSRAIPVLVFATALVFVSTSGARPGGRDALAGQHSTSAACPPHPSGTTCPHEVSPPVISGAAMVGDTLTGSPGTWKGTQPITYKFQWLRCKADSGDDTSTSSCADVSGATTTSYTVTSSDIGLRIRFRVQASNKAGATTSTSAATSVVTTEGGVPANASAPTISGSAVVGATLTASTGTWVGDQPITYSFIWLRCNTQGDNCSEIQGANDTDYEVRDADTGHTIRVRVVARNDRGSTSAISNPTATVGGGSNPSGGLDVGQLQAAGDRLVVAQVQFNPNPVTSSTAPITARVKITARGGRAVTGARVFMRGTPRVVQGQTQVSQGDGWATLTLVPNAQFPKPRNGFNVQFFIKAFRSGDPALGGIAGYRLVQVRLAGGA